MSIKGSFGYTAFISAIAVLILGTFLINFSSSFADDKKTSPCDGRQWKDPSEELDCRYPYPPIGRWKAVYTADFAKSQNLPPENISTDLSPGVDYMEMDVQPYNQGKGTACLVNMLIKRPNDVALIRGGWEPIFSEDRRLLHMIDFSQHKHEVKATGAFYFSSYDYIPDHKGFAESTFALYVEDAISEYDYLSVDAECRGVSMNPQYFPSGYSLWVMKASIWGKYNNIYKNIDAVGRPKSKQFYDSHFFIRIPSQLVKSIFENVPIGGR